MHQLAVASGLKGLVLLFDEFEDVVTNLRGINLQEQAFRNMFSFFGRTAFCRVAAFAVTPEFALKCEQLLTKKDRYDFPTDKFNRLPRFKMSPLKSEDLRLLADRITAAHYLAYRWECERGTKLKLAGIVAQGNRVALEDRTRHTITDVVSVLDAAFEDRA